MKDGAGVQPCHLVNAGVAPDSRGNVCLQLRRTRRLAAINRLARRLCLSAISFGWLCETVGRFTIGVRPMELRSPDPLFSRLLKGSRAAVLARAFAIIAVIAAIDWRFDVNISFGFLYLFPMMMVGSCLSRPQIAAVAALCTGLSEAFDAFPWTGPEGIPRRHS